MGIETWARKGTYAHTNLILGQLIKKFENCDPDDREHITAQMKQLVKGKFGPQKAFIVLPSQLDTTQPEDVGYGSEEWKELAARAARVRPIHPRPYKLSDGYNLSQVVVCKKVLWHNINNPLGILAEVSRRGGRRCCFVKRNGMRCMGYGPAAVCEYHIKLVEKVPRMNDRFLGCIKSESLRTEFEKHLKDPNRRSVEAELALMRTMLSALLHRIEGTTNIKDIPFETMGAVVKLCEAVTGTVDKMASIEHKLSLRMSVDQVTLLVMNMAKLITDIVNPSQVDMERIADALENMEIRKITASSAIESTREYGFDAPESYVKCSTARDGYTDDGTVIKDKFSEEEVNEYHKGSNAFVKSVRRGGYAAKLAQVQKEAATFGPKDGVIDEVREHACP